MGYQPTLVKIQNYRMPKKQIWKGSLSLPESAGGFALKNSVKIPFDKLKPAGWMFNVKFNNDDARINTIIRLGNTGTNGYRIIKERRISQNALTFQETSPNFTAQVYYLPKINFNIKEFNHIAVTWAPTSATAVTVYMYVNGVLLGRLNTNINWSKAVNNLSPQMMIGSDYFAETLSGNINDIAYFDQQITPDDIFLAKHHRKFTNAKVLWKCDELSGRVLKDSLGKNNLDLINNAALTSDNQSWGI